MNKFEMMVFELRRINDGDILTQEQNEFYVENVVLKGCPVVASKQHFLNNQPV